MPDAETFRLEPIGFVRSSLRAPDVAPKQGHEGAPEAFIEIDVSVREGLHGLQPGHELVVVTWFHRARRDVLAVHPRGDASAPLTGVFATRSPHRPNPLGLHRVTVLALEERGLRVKPLEAVDGTPVLDLKPVLEAPSDF